jgi:hypothetical protein
VSRAEAAGAVGVLVFNNAAGIAGGMAGLEGAGVPAYTIRQDAGQALAAHLIALAGTPVDAIVNAPVVQGDVLSNFSLRGPISPPAPGAQGTGNSFDVTKPDITAPGDDIYGAWANEATAGAAEYGSTGGTSMSSPHVAGVYALLRALRPTWTAAEIKSAAMLTAVNAGGVREDVTTPWSPDDVGSGRIDVSRAANAGLVMDETFANFVAADPANGGDVRTLNLPSMRHSTCEPSCTWTRTVKSTLSTSATWTATAVNPPGFEVTVEPASFTLATAGATQVLTITATPTPGSDAIEFGALRLAASGAGATPELAMTIAVRGEAEEVVEDLIFANGFEGEGGGSTPGVYTDRDEFLAQVAEGSLAPAFNQTAAITEPLVLSNAGYSISITSGNANGLWGEPGGILTPNSSGVDIAVEFTSGSVTAVGGNFWITNSSVTPVSASVTIELSDGTTETYIASGPADFRGFITAAPITRITFRGTGTNQQWSTLSGLVVGSAR